MYKTGKRPVTRSQPVFGLGEVFTFGSDILLAHGLRTFVMHPSVPPDQGGASPATELGLGIHAGVEETSVMLHLRPDLVRLELGQRSVPEHLADFKHVRFGGSVSFGWLSNEFGTDGTLGDPTGATAEHGAHPDPDAAARQRADRLARATARARWRPRSRT